METRCAVVSLYPGGPGEAVLFRVIFLEQLRVRFSRQRSDTVVDTEQDAWGLVLLNY